MFFSRDWIVVKHKTIGIKNFTAEGNSLKLAVISDLHAGASVYQEQIHHVVDKVLENPVDAVLIVGDMVDAPVSEIEERVRPILLVTISPKFVTQIVTASFLFMLRPSSSLETMNTTTETHVNGFKCTKQVISPY